MGNNEPFPTASTPQPPSPGNLTFKWGQISDSAVVVGRYRYQVIDTTDTQDLETSIDT